MCSEIPQIDFMAFLTKPPYTPPRHVDKINWKRKKKKNGKKFLFHLDFGVFFSAKKMLPSYKVH